MRILIFFLTLFFTPCWYLALRCPWLLPENLHFILIEQSAAIPVLAQLLIIEVMIDGLRLASLNTPFVFIQRLQHPRRSDLGRICRQHRLV